MKHHVSRAIDKSVFLTSLNYLKGQLLYRLGLASHLSGATHARLRPEQSVEYIERVVADYLRYAGVDASYLMDKDVLEIGPGDNLGVALSFVAKGARTVTCVDRFSPLVDEGRNALIYKALTERCSEEERRRLGGAIPWQGSSGSVMDGRITLKSGLPMERAADHLPNGSFDVIVSRAVLEHVSDLEAAWTSMVRLLRPAGVMWHKVDLRNHSKYSQFHPLYFLTLSDASWNVVTSPDPTINRERFPTYRALAERHFRAADYHVTHVLENPELDPHRQALRFGEDYGELELRRIAEIRPRLNSRFRALADEDLLVSGIFVICRDVRIPSP